MGELYEKCVQPRKGKKDKKSKKWSKLCIGSKKSTEIASNLNEVIKWILGPEKLKTALLTR